MNVLQLLPHAAADGRGRLGLLRTAATLAVGQESESVGGGRVEGSGRQRRANRCELQVFIDRLSLVFVVTGTVA